jgi:hypothetical protein
MPLIKWSNVIEPFKIMPAPPDPAVQAPPPPVPKSVDKPWVLVVPGMRDYTHLRITATGSWTQTGGPIGQCDPDGLASTSVQVNPLAVKDCGVGALIGKLGGSSASLTMPPTMPPASPGGAAAPTTSLAEGAAFAIGSHCIVALPSSFIGPLYISFNGLVRPVLVTALQITVEGASN